MFSEDGWFLSPEEKLSLINGRKFIVQIEVEKRKSVILVMLLGLMGN
jgi:hypothetical protein